MHGKSIFKSLLLVTAVLLVLALVLGLAAFLQGPPTPAPTEKFLEQPLAGGNLENATSGAGTAPGHEIDTTPSREADEAAWDVVIELEAGEFTILPSAMGKSIQVQAEYDESLYQLERDFSPADDKGGRFWLRYGSRGGWRQLRHGLFALRQEVRSHGDEHRHREHVKSRVRIELPARVPMRLELHLEKGEAKVDLTGLSLSRLVVHHAMGELELRIDEPNPISMDELVLHSKMGEAHVSGLGNAAASIQEFHGRMGSFELDFDGAWKKDVDASVQVTMGDALVRVPQGVRLDTSNRHVLFGSLESARRQSLPAAERETAYTLRLETAAQLGSLTIR